MKLTIKEWLFIIALDLVALLFIALIIGGGVVLVKWIFGL